jgi:hypothetical protein
MISLELIGLILLSVPIVLFLLFLFFVIISFVIRDNPKINKIKKELQIILLSISIVKSLFFVIKSFVSFFTRYNAEKLSDINKIIKEVEISEKQKIENVKYTPIPTLDQKDEISKKFLNSDLIVMSNISEIEMEDVFEGEIESIPFISADLFVFKKYLTYNSTTKRFEEDERLSLLGTYYYFDIPTIEQGVNIVLIPRTHFAIFIFFMLLSLYLLWYGINERDFVEILIAIYFIASLLIEYYFEGSKTEGIKFNSYFILQTNDEIKARKILTPAVIQSIIDLREKEGEIMIAIKEGQLHVFIKNKDRFYNIYSIIPNDLTKMKENIAQQVRQEIDLIKRLLESIRLKETLYKKGIMENKKGIMENKKRIRKNKKG